MRSLRPRWGTPLLVRGYTTLLLFVLATINKKGFGLTISGGCVSVGGERGTCVVFPACPPLLSLLKSPKISSQTVRTLQRLTCSTEDHNNPKVCCPLSDIVAQTPLPLLPPPPKSRLGGPTHNNSHSHTHTVSTTTNKIPPAAVSSNVAQKTRRPSLEEEELEENVSSSLNLLPPLSECSVGAVEPSDRIVGGKAVEHGARPWMARLGYRNRDSGEIEFFCGGTVISKRYILTAAHCIDEVHEDYELEVIRVAEENTAEEEDCSLTLGCSRTVDYPVSSSTPHPQYNPEHKSHDIGLVRVDREIDFSTPFVRPICLYGAQGPIPPTRPPPQTHGFVAGWGRVKWNRGEGSKELLEIVVPVLSHEDCQGNYSTRVNISPQQQLCAGGVRGVDSCGGDSGGPLLVVRRVQSGGVGGRWGLKFFQAGVVSFGPVRCGVGGLPGVYTYVASYLPWILKVIRV